MWNIYGEYYNYIPIMTTYMYIDFMFHVATAQLWAGLQRMSYDDCYSVCRDFDASIMHNVPVSFSMYRICALFKATLLCMGQTISHCVHGFLQGQAKY